MDVITTAKGEFVVRSYDVVVDDGQLMLRLADAGGADAYAVINALEVASARAAAPQAR